MDIGRARDQSRSGVILFTMNVQAFTINRIFYPVTIASHGLIPALPYAKKREFDALVHFLLYIVTIWGELH
jgi:hypothetical protein